MTVTWPGSRAVLKDIWGLAPSFAPTHDVAISLQESEPSHAVHRTAVWSVLGRGGKGGQDAWLCGPFSKGINKSLLPEGASSPERQLAGCITHIVLREKISGIPLCWSWSVNKEQIVFCDNYQVVEMHCSLPTPKTLLGAPAVLTTLRAPLPGPQVLFQDKGSSSVFVLVFHQHLKPSSPRLSWDSVFCLEAGRN